jgi:transposase
MNYFTGCDSHNRTSHFQHMDEEGALGLSMKVPTDKESINKFLNFLDEPTTMTLEAGRNWWWLYQLFDNHPRVSDVNVVDPRRSRVIAEELSIINGYGRAKNDRIDAEMLADQTRRGLAPKIRIPTPEQLEMRTLNRYRFNSVINRTRAKNEVHSILAMHGKTAKISYLAIDSGMDKKFKETLPGYVTFIVEQLLEQIYILEKQIDLSENMLNSLLPKSHPQIKLLLTVPGIGIVIARIIYTEIFDIAYFKEPKYLISYSGIAPVDNDSDGKKGFISLNRHCNYYLKYAFVEAAHNARKDIKYRRQYQQNIKKHGKVIAKLNLARRIAKSVYWMLIHQQTYKY